jgi:hypothetical protein
VPHRVILVSAPPGFGKTTLATQWLARQPFPAAWLALDESDNGPERFVRYLVAAIEGGTPCRLPNSATVLAAAAPLLFDHLCEVIVSELSAAETRLILVLEDYHRVESKQIHGLIERLVETMPPSMQLLVLSRVDPPWPLGRWRAQGWLGEVRAREMRFSLEESQRFFAAERGAVLSRGTVEKLHERRWSAAASTRNSSCVTARPCWCVCRKRVSTTTSAASRSASTSKSVAGRSPRSGTRTAISRCWSTSRAAPARGLPDVKLGFFNAALDEHAKKDGWTVVSMKRDWKTVFATAPSTLTAIDILLAPDATMVQHAGADNTRLRGVYPGGFALDAAHRPHITMIQCFVRTADLDKVFAAEGKVFARARIGAMKLEAFKYYYAPTGGTGVAGICARPTPELLKLQADVIAAVKPYMQPTGPIGAFTASHGDPALDSGIIRYVSDYVPNMSGRNFNPHVSIGVAPRAYLDKMLAEPFKPFTFSPAGAAVFQLGPYGTAAKKLAGWEVK